MLYRLGALGGRIFYLPRLLPSTSQCSGVRLYSDEHLPPREVHIPIPSARPTRISSTSKPPPVKGDKGMETTTDSHDVANPGPPVTLDYMPVPFQKYGTVHSQLQSKFNRYLAIGAALFALSLYLAIKEDLFAKEALRPPASYRNRKKAYLTESKSKKSEPEASHVVAAEELQQQPEVVQEVEASPPPTPETSEQLPPEKPAKSGAMPIVVKKLQDENEDDKEKRISTEGKKRIVAATDHDDKSIAEKPSKRWSSERYSHLPEEIPYLLIGAGTAAYYAALSIRARDADAKVLMIGEENQLPYNRPPLSKELWWYGDDKMADTLEYKGLSGKKKDVYYETHGFYVPPEEVNDAQHGGVSLLMGHRVVKLDPIEHYAYLDDGRKIKYGKCLIATGGVPRNLPVFEEAGEKVNEKVTLFRTIDDFRKLDKVAKQSRSLTIVGGGFLGSELAYSLNKRFASNGLKVTQIISEKGNVAEVLPEFLSEYTSKELRKCGVNVISETEVKNVVVDDHGCLKLTLSNGEILHTDHVVVAIGITPNTELAKASGLEVDKKNGGFIVDAELRARSDIWVAGDASSFYDVKLGRRRVEHWEHAQVTGRLAGENMTNASKPYWHQSSYYSLIAPNAHFQAVGRTDSSLPTVSVFAAPKDDSEELSKGVVFYMDGQQIIGILLFNVFGSGIDIARRIISDGKEHEDLKEVAKLFELHSDKDENDGKSADR
uniref:Apoptosis-inducing factor 1, mitochondrial n=1 Tax=Parascaris univalens TaxID=6257 RepID=A0A915AZG7_PARUN